MTAWFRRSLAPVADEPPRAGSGYWRIAAQILWLALAAGILCWGAKRRFALPLEPLLDADSFGYLNPGFSKLTGGGFGHSIGREFLYPAVVFLNLCAFGDFKAISVCQHLVGLATAAVMLLAWQALLALRPAPRVAVHDARSFLLAVARQAPAFLMAVVYLGYLPTLLSEHTIRPEAIFPFFAMLSIWANLRFIRLCWLEARADAAWKLGADHLFLTGVLFMLRPSFVFGAVLSNLPLAAALCRRAGLWSAKWRPVAVAVAGAVLLLFLPEAILRRHDRLAVTLLPSMRLLVHANIVLRQIDDDLASRQPTRYDRTMLQGFRDRLAPALEESRRPENRPWKNLGFNPDYIYLQRPPFEPCFPAADPRADHALADFCNYYCVRMSVHHPLMMAGKVLAQLSYFYSFEPTIKFPANHFSGFHRFHRNQDRVPFNAAYMYPLVDVVTAYPPFRRLFDLSSMGSPYLQRCRALAHSTKTAARIPAIVWVDDLLEAVYLPILLLAATASVLVLCAPRWRDTLGPNAWATLLLYGYNFGTSLTIATVFFLSQSRYVDMQKAFTLFSELSGLLFLVRCAVRWRRRPGNGPDDGRLATAGWKDHRGDGTKGPPADDPVQ